MRLRNISPPKYHPAANDPTAGGPFPFFQLLKTSVVRHTYQVPTVLEHRRTIQREHNSSSINTAVRWRRRDSVVFFSGCVLLKKIRAALRKAVWYGRTKKERAVSHHTGTPTLCIHNLPPLLPLGVQHQTHATIRFAVLCCVIVRRRLRGCRWSGRCGTLTHAPHTAATTTVFRNPKMNRQVIKHGWPPSIHVFRIFREIR